MCKVTVLLHECNILVLFRPLPMTSMINQSSKQLLIVFVVWLILVALATCSVNWHSLSTHRVRGCTVESLWHGQFVTRYIVLTKDYKTEETHSVLSAWPRQCVCQSVTRKKGCSFAPDVVLTLSQQTNLHYKETKEKREEEPCVGHI